MFDGPGSTACYTRAVTTAQMQQTFLLWGFSLSLWFDVEFGGTEAQKSAWPKNRLVLATKQEFWGETDWEGPNGL
jgi:hypothetical protein